MNKKLLAAVVSVFVIGGIFTGCSSKGKNGASDDKTIKIGASLTPHTEILEHIKPALEKEGIKLDIVSFDSDDELNPALDEKQIDANYFQHVPYLEAVSKEKGYKFAVAGKVHVEPMGFYSQKLKSIDDIKDGAKIGIPNNPSNEYRALVLLQAKGLIKIKSGIANYTATPADITDNPKHLKFQEIDVAQLPRSLPDLDGAVINTNTVLEAKLDPSSALFREDANSPYANVVVVRKGDENSDKIKKLVAALNSEDVRNFIKQKYGVAVVPAF